MIFNMTGGGSNPLNFQVKTYPSETELKADNPKENTIGVITTTTMSSWVFSATEPAEPEVGMVWISVGTFSNCEFNALKGQNLQVYPINAKQYIGGAFVNKTAMSYQCGEWVNWSVYLYKSGNEYTDITGGWVQTVTDNHSEFVKADSFMKLRVWYGYSVKAGTNNAINLNGFTQLHFKIGAEGADSTGGIEFFVASTKTGEYIAFAYVNSCGENKVITIDISAVQDSAFIGMYVFAPSGKFTHVSVKEVWMT